MALVPRGEGSGGQPCVFSPLCPPLSLPLYLSLRLSIPPSITLHLQTETVEEPIEEEEEEEEESKKEEEESKKEEEEIEDEDDEAVEDEASVEEEEAEEKPKTRKVEKTTWDWVLVNDTKPIWLRRYPHHVHPYGHSVMYSCPHFLILPLFHLVSGLSHCPSPLSLSLSPPSPPPPLSPPPPPPPLSPPPRSTKEVEDEEYAKFYKVFTKDSQDPLASTHFVAEGEVTFRSILFVPPVSLIPHYCYMSATLMSHDCHMTVT